MGRNFTEMWDVFAVRLVRTRFNVSVRARLRLGSGLAFVLRLTS